MAYFPGDISPASPSSHINPSTSQNSSRHNSFSSDTDESLLQNELSQILTSGEDFLALGQRVICHADSHGLEIQNKIHHFREMYASQLQSLHEKGWMGVKSSLKEKMALEHAGHASFFQVRQEYIKLVQQACLDIVQTMGYPNPGFFSAEGTPGWDSDIDTVYFSPPNMSEAFASHVLTIFHGLTAVITFSPSTHLFTDSGHTFDTECYLQAAKQNPENFLHTAEGFSTFSCLETSAAHLQLTYGLRESPDILEETARARLAQCLSPDIAATLSESLEDSKALVLELEDEIATGFLEDCHHHGIDLKVLPLQHQNILRANFERAFKQRLIYSLSCEMDQLDVQLRCLEEQFAYLTVSSQDMLEPLYAHRDALLNEKANIMVIRNLLLPESYFGMGAFLNIVADAEGQIWQRAVEKGAQRARDILLDPRADMARQSAPILRLPRNSPAKRRSSALNQMSSMHENLSMYESHFQHALKQKSLQESLITTSKYAQRVMRSATELTRVMSSQRPEIRSLQTACQKYLVMATELEKCKRKTSLNDTASRVLLEDVLKAKMTTYTQADLAQDIQVVLKKTEDTPFKDYPPEIRYASAIGYLSGKGYIETPTYDAEGNLLICDHTLDTILRARCGFPTSIVMQVKKGRLAEERTVALPEMIAIHKKAEGITLLHLGLDSENAIIGFNHMLEYLVGEVSQRCYQANVVPKPLKIHTPALSLYGTFLRICGRHSSAVGHHLSLTCTFRRK